MTLKICQRFHFASALKRMSAVSAIQTASVGPTHLVTVKGAPEVLQDMFASLPANYQSTYTKLTRQGSRVLALGYRHLGNLSLREVGVVSCERFSTDWIVCCTLLGTCPQTWRCGERLGVRWPGCY